MSRTLLTLSSLALGFTALVGAPSANVAAAPLAECTTVGTNTFDIDTFTGTDTFTGQGFEVEVSWEIDGNGNITVSAEVVSGEGFNISRLGYHGMIVNGELVTSALFAVDVPPAISASHTFAPAIGQEGIVGVEVGFSECPIVEQVTTTTVTAGSGGSLPSTGSGNETALIAVALLGLGGALTLLVRRPRTHA